jgi:hypothetical protein
MNLGMCLALIGRFDEAAASFDESLHIATELREEPDVAMLHSHIALMHILRGKPADAISHTLQALRWAVRENFNDVKVNSVIVMAMYHADTDPERAVAWLTTVMSQPYANPLDLQLITREMLPRVTPRLTADQLAAAQASGRTLTMDDIIAQILSEEEADTTILV